MCSINYHRNSSLKIDPGQEYWIPAFAGMTHSSDSLRHGVYPAEAGFLAHRKRSVISPPNLF